MSNKGTRFSSTSTRLYLVQLATMLINRVETRHLREIRVGILMSKDRSTRSYIDSTLTRYALLALLDCA